MESKKLCREDSISKQGMKQLIVIVCMRLSGLSGLSGPSFLVGGNRLRNGLGTLSLAVRER